MKISMDNHGKPSKNVFTIVLAFLLATTTLAACTTATPSSSSNPSGSTNPQLQNGDIHKIRLCCNNDANRVNLGLFW